LFSTIVNKQAKKKLHINPRFFLVYKHARNWYKQMFMICTRIDTIFILH
jgi:hypothetical protein